MFNEKNIMKFSSPIGAFIFLITITWCKPDFNSKGFSSPIGAFIFLIMHTFNNLDDKGQEMFSSPIGAFIFLILVLQSLYLCGLKRCFAV